MTTEWNEKTAIHSVKSLKLMTQYNINVSYYAFLVAGRDYTTRFVSRLVGWSTVGWSVGHILLFLWFYFFDLTAPAQMV